MKQNILVVFTGPMELGGIERSLVGLLGALDYEKYNVDLFLYGHHGPLFSMIDSRVNLLPEVRELAYLRESFGAKLRHRCYDAAWMRLKDKVLPRPGPARHEASWARLVEKHVPKLERHYDLALGFFRPFDLIAEKVDADVKVGWVHTDYTRAGEPLDLLEADYQRMDRVAAVSQRCGELFRELFPSLSDRVTTVENLLPETLIRQQAEQLDVTAEMPDDGSIKLLTVGRFCPAKGMDNIPELCRRIRRGGLDVTWYLIGFGEDERLIREKIRETGMEGHVVVLGRRENPYPYMKACDVYVQPSRFEGRTIAVREAQLLHRPVAITDYPTAASQLEDGVDGVIVPMDLEGCARGLAALLRDEPLRRALAENTKGRAQNKAETLEKLEQLMGEGGRANKVR